jgi:hypothetical protein
VVRICNRPTHLRHGLHRRGHETQVVVRPTCHWDGRRMKPTFIFTTYKRYLHNAPRLTKIPVWKCPHCGHTITR